MRKFENVRKSCKCENAKIRKCENGRKLLVANRWSLVGGEALSHASPKGFDGRDGRDGHDGLLNKIPQNKLVKG